MEMFESFLFACSFLNMKLKAEHLVFHSIAKATKTFRCGGCQLGCAALISAAARAFFIKEYIGASTRNKTKKQ